MIATRSRVLSDGPVANKSFIANASYQLKVLQPKTGMLKRYPRINIPKLRRVFVHFQGVKTGT